MRVAKYIIYKFGKNMSGKYPIYFLTVIPYFVIGMATVATFSLTAMQDKISILLVAVILLAIVLYSDFKIKVHDGIADKWLENRRQIAEKYNFKIDEQGNYHK